MRGFNTVSSNLLEMLMDRAGVSKVPRYAKENYGFRGRVMYTSEFRRIENIPRREWNVQPYIQNVVDILTDALKTPDGRMRLWEIQAAALNDAVLYKGGFFPIAVGRGKALISLLVPVVLNAKRPVLFVPAQLREQTKRYVIPKMIKHWNLCGDLQVIGYSELSLEKNAEMLERLEPDLIVLDECHRVKNKKAGRTKRLIRYFRERPETMCIAMSGTVSSRSIKDFAHIAEWCLKGNTPVPLKWQELTEWADALDSDVPDGQRIASGALKKFCDPDENVRQGFRRRLVSTPGVVASEENELGTSLRIQGIKNIIIPPRTQKVINDVRTYWETPNGDIITQAVDLWRHLRELSLGFWYRWEPEPPRDWLDARREWKKYVRETLKHNRRNLDTELQVWNECMRADIPPECWIDWRDIKDSYTPNTVAVWLNDFALDVCAEWMDTSWEPSIIWTEHRAFGEKLEQHTGRAYFGAGNDEILNCNTGQKIIASRQAHAEGKNLERYCRNLVVAPMSSGKAWEQLLGRTHRPGQLADEVTCDVFMHTDELFESFRTAQADAIYLEDTFGNVQKLNYADVII